jgi:hypothetical protein
LTTSHSAPRQPADALPSGRASAPPENSALDAALATVEHAIAALGDAMTGTDIAAIESASTELQAAMRAAMTSFAQLARRGNMPVALRHRLALANARITAQREALFRAGSGVDQQLEIMFPRPVAQSSVYSASGASGRGPGRVIAAS